MSIKGPDCKLFEFFGVELGEENGSGQYKTTCPFCDREGHFYINVDTAQYRCQDGKCAAEGNAYTFMEQFYQQALKGTKEFAYKRLSGKRKGFNSQAYKDEGIAWSSELNKFLFPDRNEKGKMTNLAQWSGDADSRVYGAPGCTNHFFGLHELAKTGPIFVCEGRWDRIALKWLLKKLELPGEYSVLGAPGATNLPKSDLSLLKGREVYLLYDNDDAGLNGMKMAVNKLVEITRDIHILGWPDNVPEKYDVEDYIRESTDRPETVWERLLGWCFRFQHGDDPTVKPPELVRNTIEEIYQDFTDTHIHLYQGLKDFLVLALATIKSTLFDGEPLWLYGIGDPGRGKSLVLESSLASRKCIYRTSVTHKAFISGYRKEGEDNSLLALLPGNTLIVKDYSNVLSLPHLEQEQLVALLREAYDGRIVRSWGNGVYREYPPADSPFNNCRFSLVAGVTKEIHSKSHAGLGERFLKYEIPCSEEDNIRAMMAALDDTWKTHELQVHRARAVAAFLDRPDPEVMPDVPDWFKEKIIALSQFVGFCRSPVSRTHGDLDYAPSPESGTRVAKQLRKFAQSICLVLNLPEANDEVYRLVRKVAWDTGHGWRRDLYLSLYRNDGSPNTHQVADLTGFSIGTVHRQLHDMRALKLVSNRINGKAINWSLNKHAKDLILKAQLEEEYNAIH